MYFYGDPSWNQKPDAPPPEKNEDATSVSHDVSEIIKSNKHFHGFKDQKIDRTLTRKMLDHITLNPTEFAKRVSLNAIGYYFPTMSDMMRDYRDELGNLTKLALTIFHLGLWILASVGIWHARKKQESMLPIGFLLGAVVLYAIWYFPFHTSVSHTLYTFGIMPILAMLAALGVAYCRGKYNLGR